LLLLTGDKSSEELLLETSDCDSEINDSGLGGKLRRPQRVGHTGGHVQTEFIIVVILLISEHEQLVSSLNNDLFLKKGIKHGVNFILDVLNQDWEAFHERHLECISQAGMGEREDKVEFVKFFLTVLNPGDSL